MAIKKVAKKAVKKTVAKKAVKKSTRKVVVTTTVTRKVIVRKALPTFTLKQSGGYYHLREVGGSRIICSVLLSPTGNCQLASVADGQSLIGNARALSWMLRHFPRNQMLLDIRRAYYNSLVSQLKGTGARVKAYTSYTNSSSGTPMILVLVDVAQSRRK